MVTIYIDTADISKGKQRYCHMAVALGADLNQLHAFADLIGLKRCWFENNPRHPHYDVNAVLKAKALKLHGSTIEVNGVAMPLSVIEISPFEFVDRCSKRISAPKNSIATMFGGGEGVGEGAKMAGLIHLWGIEHDPKIADVARMNGYYMITADVCAVDYSTLAKPWWLHASPPCINASVAKKNKGETEHDGLLADAIIRAISDLLPERFSLENVRGYMHFTCYGRIKDHLKALGYAFVERMLNAADYGTPQTRERLFLIASRTSTPRIPDATHYDARSGNMNMFKQPWVGWYESISDLVDTLEDTQFAPWQIERLPKELLATTLHGVTNRTVDGVGVDSPAFTITAVHNQPSIRAVIVDTTNSIRESTVREDNDPVFTILSSHFRRPSTEPKAILINSVNAGQTYSSGSGSAAMPAMTISTQSKPKALLVSRQTSNNGESVPVIEDDTPSFSTTTKGGFKALLVGNSGYEGGIVSRDGTESVQTITANENQGNLRAFVVSGGNHPSPRESDSPYHTITNCSDRDRAFVVSGGNSQTAPRDADDPAYTVCGNSGSDRAAVAGRIVRINSRCLARFNGLPDTYQLPAKNGLACMVLGNMVMPRVIKAIIEANR